MEKGQKFSGDKLPMFKVLAKQFPRAFQEVARNSNAGHKKYIEADSNWDNWKHVKGGKETYLDAALRHLIQSENGVWDKDTEQYGGTRHLAAVAWNVLAALELDLIAEEEIEKGWEDLKGQDIEIPIEFKDCFKAGEPVFDVNLVNELMEYSYKSGNTTSTEKDCKPKYVMGYDPAVKGDSLGEVYVYKTVAKYNGTPNTSPKRD